MDSTLRTLAVSVSVFAFFAVSGSAARAQDPDWALKMFEEKKHDFGVVARGAKVEHLLKLTNGYKQTVHISGVRTSCGCAAAEPTKNTLASRESAYIKISMDTKKFTRRKTSNVIVTFDAPVYAEVKIPVSSYIRTDVVVTPGSVNFGKVDLGKDATQTVDIAYAGRPDWNIREVRNGNKYLDAKIVETKREGGRVAYHLTMKLKDDAPAGTLRQQITLVTDDAKSPYVPVLVQAEIESDVTITPAVASFGTMTPGSEKTIRVVVRRKEAFTIEKVECESDRECFKVAIPTGKKIVQIVPLTFTAPQESGALTEELTITIAGREEPVSLKATATVTPQ